MMPPPAAHIEMQKPPKQRQQAAPLQESNRQNQGGGLPYSQSAMAGNSQGNAANGNASIITGTEKPTPGIFSR